VQIHAAASEIQRLEHSAIAKACIEIVVKSTNMNGIRNFSRLPSKHLEKQFSRWKLLIGTTFSKVLTFKYGKSNFSRLFHVFYPPNEGEGELMGLILVSWKAHFPFPITCSFKLF